MLNFTNLSPYTVTVAFPLNNEDCWHNELTTQDNIDFYYRNYAASTTSEEQFLGYLNAFKETFGIANWQDIPAVNMNNTQITLARAEPGRAVSHGVVYGEVSAALFDGCKNATSTRGFTINFKDDSGQPVASHHYILQDPPDQPWQLAYIDANDQLTPPLVLGEGGQTSVAAATVVALSGLATVVTLGRAAYGIVGTAGLLSQVGGQGLAGASVFTIGLRRAVGGVIAREFSVMRLFKGVMYYVARDKVKEIVMPSPPGLNESTKIQQEFASLKLNDQPNLIAAGGLPQASERSICIYSTNSWYVAGHYECHLVGAELIILPDGSLQFMPLPVIGSGV
jgi:hypothetical protein